MDAKHLVICTLDDGASILVMELMVSHRQGYIPASANRPRTPRSA